jgi:hypothetical protein
LKKWLANLKEDEEPTVIHREKKLKEDNPELLPLKDFRIPKVCFFNEYDESDLVKIMDEQMAMINNLKDGGSSKFLANR